MIQGESHTINPEAINSTYCKTKFDWVESDLHNCRRMGDTNSPDTWSHSDSSKPVM